MSGVRVSRPRGAAIGIVLTIVLLSMLVLSASALAGIGFVSGWGERGSGNGQFRNPIGLTTDPVGDVYVAEQVNRRIQKFTPTGGFLLKLGDSTGPFASPSDVATDAAGNFYVAGQGNEVQKFTSAGAFITRWGSLGDGNGEFANPRGIAVGPEGNVYVADRENHRIQKFSSTGAFLTKWGKKGKLGSGQLKFPEGVATDAAGRVYVADTDADRIQKFSSSGKFLTAWGTRGTRSGEFKRHTAVDTVRRVGNLPLRIHIPENIVTGRPIGRTRVSTRQRGQRPTGAARRVIVSTPGLGHVQNSPVLNDVDAVATG